MWTSKIVPHPCPTCGGQLELTLVMEAKESGAYSLAGVQMKFSVQAVPRLDCSGNWNPPLGQRMSGPCGYRLYGAIDDEGNAVFQP